MNALRALFPFALLVSCVRADLPSHCDIDHVFGVWRVARLIVTLIIQKLSCICSSDDVYYSSDASQVVEGMQCSLELSRSLSDT